MGKKETDFSFIDGANAAMRFTCLYLITTFILVQMLEPDNVSVVSLLLNPIYIMFTGFEFYVGGKKGALRIKAENEKRKDERDSK